MPHNVKSVAVSFKELPSMLPVRVWHDMKGRRYWDPVAQPPRLHIRVKTQVDIGTNGWFKRGRGVNMKHPLPPTIYTLVFGMVNRYFLQLSIF